jgi:AcrR family transcriptional regulator
VALSKDPHVDNEQTKRKSRVPAAVAKERLVETTISLLRTEPFYEVTTRRITREAGLPLAALSRNFGSLPGLFDAVAHELVKRFTDQFTEYGPLDALTNPDLILRTRLVAWSIGQGADPLIFRPDPSAWSRVGMERQQRLAGVDERMGTAWAEIVTFVLEGYAIFSQTHTLSNQETFDDCMTVMTELQKSLKGLESRLGWTTPIESAIE